MANGETERKCFTFVWKLENISYSLQKKGELLESPAFVVDAIEKTKWKLMLFPRGNTNGNYIGLFLNREYDSKGAHKVEIEFELAFIAQDGSTLISHGVLKRAFPKDGDYGYSGFLRREDIYIARRSEFLLEDTLTVRCRMWRSVGNMTEDVQCMAVTRIGVERRSFRWNIKNFSTLGIEEKCNYLIKSIENETPLISINLFFTEGLSSGEIIHFELSLCGPTIKCFTLQLYLINAFGNKVECNQDDFWFDTIDEMKHLTFHFTKKKLLTNQNIYLPDDVLSLYFEWAFSKGVVFEAIEEVQSEYTGSSEGRSSDHQSVNNKNWNDNLKSLYDRHAFCDVKLMTSTSIFPAHKIILSSFSSVFNAMFTNDMIEKNSDSVSIIDLNDDTVSGMLCYMYTARVEDLSWESAWYLYAAADKYDILNLKILCSSYLKEHLTPDNSCEILVLSDLHADGDLKSAVQDYILKHIKEIVKMDEWKLLLETNAKLAADTMSLQYK